MEVNYPCSFPIKVFVRPDSELEANIERTVRGLLTAKAELSVQKRASSNGRYTCVTLTFNVDSAEQASHIGATVRDLPGVILAL